MATAAKEAKSQMSNVRSHSALSKTLPMTNVDVAAPKYATPLKKPVMLPERPVAPNRNGNRLIKIRRSARTAGKRAMASLPKAASH
jgi:hypothetical protein